VFGWYPFISTVFTGSETTLTLSDGLVIPLQSVTVDNNPATQGRPLQYMAAVYSKNLAYNLKPWASNLFQKPNEGFSRVFGLSSDDWIVRYTKGALLEAFSTGMGQVATGASVPGAPTVSTPAATMTWEASLNYEGITGNCMFFDFNWVALFKASANNTDPARIVVVSNPAGNHLAAQVIGQPIAVANGGMLYNTIRILKLDETIAAGAYVFQFTVYDTLGQSTNAQLTLTVA
jgi:hypothetical protein